MNSGKNIDIFGSRDLIRNEIIQYSKEYMDLDSFDWEKSSYLSYLVNVISALTANLMYYTNSVHTEFFLTQAKQKQSVSNLASMLGYTPAFATPAYAQVLVEIPTSFSSNVVFTIPQNFKFMTSDNIVFTQDSPIVVEINRDENGNIYPPVVIEQTKLNGNRVLKTTLNEDKSLLYFAVNVTQKNVTYVEHQIPELKTYEFHKIDSKVSGQIAGVDLVTTQERNESSLDSYISLIESGLTPPENSIYQVWKRYDSLFLIPSNEWGYTFRTKNDGIQIFFGNNIVGKQPKPNHICRVAVVTTEGNNGNVIAGSITKADKLFIDDYDSEKNKKIRRAIALRVVNTSSALGGKDSPTIDEIRRRAVANVTSNNRLVSKFDYLNVKDIIPDFPIEHSISVVKSSDLKRNEITLFTDLLFDDYIVPTRNTKWTLTNSDFDSTAGSYYIYTTDTIEIDGIEYYSMFNIRVDAEDKECTYFYQIPMVEKSVSTSWTNQQVTANAIPSSSRFYTDAIGNQETDSLEVVFSYDLIQDSTSSLTCKMVTDWNGTQYDLVTFVDPDNGQPGFTTSSKTLILKDIPSGKQIFRFLMFQDIAGVMTEINNSQVEIIVKQDLSDYMYSQVHVLDTTGGGVEINVFDVPVIKKSYYDVIDQNTFNLQVYNKIISIDIGQYRMSNVFLNLKFANTSGLMTNMKFNKESKNPVKSINPAAIPAAPVNKERYIVTKGDNPWGYEDACIVEYKSAINQWTQERLATNDIIKVESLDNAKLLYNGTNMVLPITTIPFEIKLIVWKSRTYSASETSILNNIRDTLVEELFRKFGFDQNIYLSEIVRIVQSIPGVEFCHVAEPQHDIFFNFDIYKDFSQSELLEYTPEFISFITSSIFIELR